jgi:tetratricopeptide (TPR) repeat protein
LYLDALIEARKIGDNSDETEALSMIARTFLIMNEVDSAHQWLLQAEKVAVRIEPMGWSRYQAVQGRYLWHIGDMQEATRLFKDLYDYCVRHNLHERAVDAAHMVAITGTRTEQVDWAYRGISQAEAGNITGWLGPLWNNLGATYEEMRRFDSAYQAYLKAREYHYRYGTERNKVIADWAVGHILVKLGRYEEAGEWLQPVLKQCETAEDHEFVGLTCRDLGEIGYESGNYQEALQLYQRAESLLKEAGMDEWDPEGYRELLDRIHDTQRKIE